MGNEEQKIYDDEPVSKLLGGLKRVEAPNDFEFRVKARIAEGKPADSSASWLPASVRYAVPLALLVLVGGYFAFNAMYSPSKIDVPAVTEAPAAGKVPGVAPSSNAGVVLPSNKTAVDQVQARSPEIVSKVDTLAPEKKVSSPAPASKQPAGGSMDQASSKSRVIYPRGLDPNTRSTPIPAKNILNLLGVGATFNASGWSVDSVRANSIAGRSGVKGGDVIEAFNDQPLTDKTTFGNRSSLRNIRVRRDGKSVQIELKP